MSDAAISQLLLLQLAIEALLVVLVVVVLKRSRSAGRGDPARMPENLKNSIEQFLADSEKIAQTFERNLADKKNLSADLILKLDRRLSEYQILLKQTEAGFNAAQKKLAALKSAPAAAKGADLAAPVPEGKANPAAPEVRALVLQMARKGHTPDEIAAKTRLHRGEVELIIDLDHQFTL
ncbi:MAG: hypothetical protein LBP55_04375 [Candidatus Adiutrix sp.]|nr:hypothetical protein [Candidatus Adiutrix sp.]